MLIIDEFQATDPELILEARAKWENSNERKIKSIVIAQISPHLYNVTPAFKERLGNRIITLRPLDDDEMKEILKRRLFNPKTKINYYNKLDEEAVKLLVACADGNPRRLLEYTDYVFDFHFNKFGKINPMLVNEYKVTYWGVKEILELHNINTNAYMPEKEKRRIEKNISFEERFTKSQQNVLKFLMTGPKTMEEIQEWFKYSKSKTKKILKELRDDGSIIPAGKKGKKRLWQIAPHVKIITVKV